jgi:hypothetical protein
MVTAANTETLRAHGFDWITALKAPQVQALVEQGQLQLSLFDETNLAEVASDRYPGERLVVCRNPHVARERARLREALLAATETELAKVKASVDNPRGRLHGKPAGPIGERAGRVVNRFKVAKHFQLTIADGRFDYARDGQAISQEAALDGLYVRPGAALASRHTQGGQQEDRRRPPRHQLPRPTRRPLNPLPQTASACAEPRPASTSSPSRTTSNDGPSNCFSSTPTTCRQNRSRATRSPSRPAHLRRENFRLVGHGRVRPPAGG